MFDDVVATYLSTVLSTAYTVSADLRDGGEQQEAGEGGPRPLAQQGDAPRVPAELGDVLLQHRGNR